VREAAGRGAQIICLKELFATPYFCKAQRSERFDLAEPVPGPTTDAMQRLARELSVVIVAPFFERQAAEDDRCGVELRWEVQGAETVRGATVYTLSERASDEQARLMAEKENASDLVAGLISTEGEASDQVRNILFDLMKRETANFSADLSNVLVRNLQGKVNLSRDPQRAAAFKVLKQSHAPSVLVELGYLSHLEDEKLLNSASWQKQMAASIASAVDAYFAKRTVSTP